MACDLLPLGVPVAVASQHHEPTVSSPPENAASVPSVLRKIAKWASKPSCGKPVWPTRFIPSKTPLTEELLRERFPVAGACEYPHTVPRLLNHCCANGWPVGLIINLAAQDGLYAAEVPADLPTRHVGLESKSLPSEEDVAKVIEYAAQFWQQHPDTYIAIHCAYGYNRSGFCISSYCIERCGLSVSAALTSFAHSREGGVHHEEFAQELLRRYAHVPAPIQSFDPNMYRAFYCGASSAGRSQLQALWRAAGHAEGGWMVSAAANRKAVPHGGSGRWSVATDDSHNDLETLLIASQELQEPESTLGSAVHGVLQDKGEAIPVGASKVEL